MRCLRSAGLPPSTGSPQKAARSPGCRTVSVMDWPPDRWYSPICRDLPPDRAASAASCSPPPLLRSFCSQYTTGPAFEQVFGFEKPDLACALPRPPLQAGRCAEKDPRQPSCLGSFDTVLQRYLVRTRRTGASEGLITSARPWRRPLPAASSEPRHPPWKHPPSGSWERPRR